MDEHLAPLRLCVRRFSKLRYIWVLVLGLTLLQALGWQAITPPWTAPDEPGHYLYVRLYAETGHPPTPNQITPAHWREILASLEQTGWQTYIHGSSTPDISQDSVLAASGLQVGQKAPGYYALAASWLKLRPNWRTLPLVAQWRWLRWLSLLLRLATTGVALLLGAKLWPEQPHRILSLGLLSGLMPMVGFVGGSLNNDALTLLWGAASFTALMLARNRPQKALALLLILSGPLLIDISLFYLWPLALWRAWRWQVRIRTASDRRPKTEDRKKRILITSTNLDEAQQSSFGFLPNLKERLKIKYLSCCGTAPLSPPASGGRFPAILQIFAIMSGRRSRPKTPPPLAGEVGRGPASQQERKVTSKQVPPLGSRPPFPATRSIRDAAQTRVSRKGAKPQRKKAAKRNFAPLRKTKFQALALLGLGLLLLLPTPRHAAGWRWQNASRTRDQSQLYLQADRRPQTDDGNAPNLNKSPQISTESPSNPDETPPRPPSIVHRPTLTQIRSGKDILRLSGQNLHLSASVSGQRGPLILRLSDARHSSEIACPLTPEPNTCQLDHLLSPGSQYIAIIAQLPQGSSHFQLSLKDETGHEWLRNGGGQRPAPVAAPLFTWLERHLPLPAGYFSHLFSPGIWAAPALLRYILYAGFTWASFWGIFGWLNRAWPLSIYLLLALATLAAAAGLLRQRLTPRLRLAAVALLLILAQTWLPMLGSAWQPQGRYLFPALLPISLLLLEGWYNVLGPKHARWLPHLLLSGLIALNLLAWQVVR